MIALYIVLGLLALLIAVLLIRTALFRPTQEPPRNPAAVEFDRDKAVSDLAEMIRCRTVSDTDRSKEDEAEFEKFKALLPRLFPNVAATCSLEQPSDRSLLYRWKGADDKTPTVLMAHFDVVSVEEKNWTRPPFEGKLENGVLWGRGTLDTKGTLNGAIQAVETLIGQGFVPKHDVYLAFAGDEEINGYGATKIVELFEQRGLTPGIVVDEGGAVVENLFPGVHQPCAVIGIAEKGMLNLEFEFSGQGGHASSPLPHTPVGRLAAACVKVENHPFRFQVSRPAAEMFDTLGRRSSFLFRMIFANLRVFAPLLNSMCKKQGGELNALLRTTCAFTQMEGSKGMNVIPPHAKMLANLRLVGTDTMDSAEARIRTLINDPDIRLRQVSGMNPSVISDTTGEAWDRIRSAVGDTWTDAIVSPYLMVACSDSRHWGKISDKVYRFSAMALSKEERGTIHGNDEHIPVETAQKAVEFYLRLLQRS